MNNLSTTPYTEFSGHMLRLMAEMKLGKREISMITNAKVEAMTYEATTELVLEIFKECPARAGDTVLDKILLAVRLAAIKGYRDGISDYAKGLERYIRKHAGEKKLKRRRRSGTNVRTWKATIYGPRHRWLPTGDNTELAERLGFNHDE